MTLIYSTTLIVQLQTLSIFLIQSGINFPLYDSMLKISLMEKTDMLIDITSSYSPLDVLEASLGDIEEDPCPSSVSCNREVLYSCLVIHPYWSTVACNHFDRHSCLVAHPYWSSSACGREVWRSCLVVDLCSSRVTCTPVVNRMCLVDDLCRSATPRACFLLANHCGTSTPHGISSLKYARFQF